MKHVKLPIALSALAALAACDNAPEPKEMPTFEEAADAGALPDAEKPERTGPQFAVLNSDFKSTSVSLLGLDGQLLAEDYINSGSLPAGLVSALSGDVEMPTQSGDPGVLVLIDRFKTDVITRVRLSDAKILGQVKTHTPSDQNSKSAYSSNPNDYLRVAEDTAWVTRNQPNLDPSVPEIDRGNDLLRIDPSSMERTDERIDLSSLNTQVKRKNFDTGKEEMVDIYAKPSRMARVGDTLVVGLLRSAFDFSANGTGMVALVDLNSRAVTGLELADFAGCGKVSPIPGERERVLVSCGGDFLDVRNTAGFAIVRVADGQAEVETLWRAKDHPELPALSLSSVALGGTLIGAGVESYVEAEPSVFGVLDLESSDFTQLFSLPGGTGTFGTPLYDADTGLLMVPDSSTDKSMRPSGGVHLLQRDGDTFHETELLPVARDTTLPARHVYPL